MIKDEGCVVTSCQIFTACSACATKQKAGSSADAEANPSRVWIAYFSIPPSGPFARPQRRARQKCNDASLSGFDFPRYIKSGREQRLFRADLWRLTPGGLHSQTVGHPPSSFDRIEFPALI